MSSPIAFLARGVLPALLLAAVAACEQVDVTAVPIARVEVAPPSAVVGVGKTVQLSATVLGDQDEPLSNRSIEWHSQNEDVAVVDAQGQVTGVALGTVEIQAESEGVVGVATVEVTSSPAIGAAPPTVQFSAVKGGATPGDRTIAITNAGQGSLTGLSVSVRYSAGQPTGWLSANLTGGNAPATLVLSASLSGLDTGSYTAFVDVTSGAAVNSPFTIPVTFNVLAPAPAIGLNTTAVTFQASQGGAAPTPQNVAVTNLGAGTLSGLTTSVSYSSGQPGGWLAASLGSTTAPATLTLTASTGSLTAGTYTAAVQVASGVAQNSPQTITVTLTLAAPAPIIAAAPPQLSFSGQQGGSNPPTQTIEITNSGGGSLTGLGVSVTYPGGQPGGWLTTSLNRTTAPATLTVGAALLGLAAGTYNATLRLSSPAAAAPLLIEVTLQVTAPAPAIALDRTSVSFSTGVFGGDPPSQTVQVTNGGAGTLSGLAIAVVGQNTGWLSANLAGTTAPTTIELSATRGLLLPGTYNALLRVTSGVASNSPVEIPVTFTVALGTPQKPTSLAAAAISDRRVNLTWEDRSSDEATFEIQRRSSGQDWTDIASTGVNESSYADTAGLSASVEYEYRVRACNAVGCSDWSGTAKARTAPAAPTNAAATAASSSAITVTWNDNSSDEKGFRVERSIDAGVTWTLVSTRNANTESYTDSGLAAATTYRYRIAACRDGLCSVFSNAAQATTTAGSTSTPTNLTAAALSPTEVQLSWTAPGGQTRYEVRRRAGTSGSWTFTVDVSGTTPSYKDAGLAPSSTYQYQVRACVGDNCSQYSSQATVTTPAG